MSTRMVQRLLEQRGSASLASKGSHDEPVGSFESEEEEEPERRQPTNLFALLDEDAQEENELDERCTTDGSDAESGEPEVARQEVLASGGASGGGKKSKSKRKGKKGGSKGHNGIGSSDGKPGATSGTKAEVSGSDFLSNIRRDTIESENSEEKAVTATGTFIDPASLLAVDTRILRPEEELKRIFGAKVIRSVEREERGESQFSLPGRRAGSRGAPRKAFRKSLLVQPRDYWPRWDGGLLSMEPFDPSSSSSSSATSATSSSSLLHFRYVPSPSYEYQQREFELCVGTHDPQALALLSAKNPYHADTLLAVAELYAAMGEMGSAEESMERALFALESAWHPWFDPSTGRCRLPYSHAPNRPLFHSLLRRAQHLSRRGCHAAAFQTSKLLLSLDPTADPLGVLLMIDYFALRADQHRWLLEFAAHFDSHRGLELLPNYAFSTALARFREEEERRGGGGRSGGRGKKKAEGRTEAAPVAANGADAAAASSSLQQLQEALLLHPFLLLPLLSKAAVQTSDASWSQLLQHPLFRSVPAGSPSLEHLVALYAERCALLWRPPEVQEWLKNAVAAVVAKAEEELLEEEVGSKAGGAGAMAFFGLGSKGSSGWQEQEEVANWACVRSEAFPEDEPNRYRHLLLADFSDDIAVLPAEEVEQVRQVAMVEGRGGGMLPRAEHMMVRGVAAPPAGGNGGEGVEGGPEGDPEQRQQMNILLEFLRTMLPWEGVDGGGNAAGHPQPPAA